MTLIWQESFRLDWEKKALAPDISSVLQRRTSRRLPPKLSIYRGVWPHYALPAKIFIPSGTLTAADLLSIQTWHCALNSYGGWSLSATTPMIPGNPSVRSRSISPQVAQLSRTVFAPESAVKLWMTVSPSTSVSTTLKNAKFVNGTLETCLHCWQWQVSWKLGSLADLNRKLLQVHCAKTGVSITWIVL